MSLVSPRETLEYSASDEASKILLGHKVGDVIPYNDNSFQKVEYVVKEIQSLFVRAFQEILEDYGFKFPGDAGVQTFNVENDNYSSFLLAVAKMGVHTEKIHDFLKAGAITVERYCNLTSRNQVLAFKAMQLFSGERIISCIGTHSDQETQNELANTSNKITLSLSEVDKTF